MGRPYCINTAPIPRPDALVSSMKGMLKLGKARTGAVVILCLRAEKAAVCSGPH
jgi:hypothetical protein